MNSEERLTEKYLLDLQEAFEICCAHYQAKGYSEEHSKAYVALLPDQRLLKVCEILRKEQKDAEKQGDQVL